ncbi:acyltransferase family protein [Spirosoma agri]|uniref:Acyltransferase family protein n=1 Tax=Spirosoma agri TaxID=1987381 RepID=A0A6M0IKD8_9BACT|nr:acyltransferase family protein [Spirosoma agri]
MDQRNASVDVFRFLAACVVFISHSVYSNHLSLLVVLGIVGRWALPFFFLVSGYYFEKSYVRRSTSAFTKTIIALLSVTLFINLFYLAFVGVTEGSFRPLLTRFTLLTGTYFHLWFLTSLLVSYLVLWFFLNYKLVKLLPYLAAVTIALVLLLTPYNYLVGMATHPIYARSLLSIPFLCIGFLISKHGVDGSISKPIACLLVVFGIGIQLLEGWFLSSQGQDSSRVNFLGGTLFVSIGMFLLSLQLVVSQDNILGYYGRRYSFPLYLYHPLINYFLHKSLETVLMGTVIYWLSPILALAATLLLFIYMDKFAPALFRILSGGFLALKPRLEGKPS